MKRFSTLFSPTVIYGALTALPLTPTCLGCGSVTPPTPPHQHPRVGIPSLPVAVSQPIPWTERGHIPVEASPWGGKTASPPDLISSSQLTLIIVFPRGIPLGTMAPSRFDPWGQEGNSKQGVGQPGTVPCPWANPDPHPTGLRLQKWDAQGNSAPDPHSASLSCPRGPWKLSPHL